MIFLDRFATVVFIYCHVILDGQYLSAFLYTHVYIYTTMHMGYIPVSDTVLPPGSDTHVHVIHTYTFLLGSYLS